MGLLSRFRSWQQRQHNQKSCPQKHHNKTTNTSIATTTTATNTSPNNIASPSVPSIAPPTLISPPTQTQTIRSPSLSSVSLPSPHISPSHVPQHDIPILSPTSSPTSASAPSTSQVVLEEQDHRIHFRRVKEERTCVIQPQPHATTPTHTTSHDTTTPTPAPASIIQVIVSVSAPRATSASTSTTPTSITRKSSAPSPKVTSPTPITIDVASADGAHAPTSAPSPTRAHSISFQSPSSTQLYDHDPITPSQSCITSITGAPSKYHHEQKQPKSPSHMSTSPPASPSQKPTTSCVTSITRSPPLSAHPAVYAAYMSSSPSLSPHSSSLSSFVADSDDIFPPYSPPLYSTANYEMPWMYSPTSTHGYMDLDTQYMYPTKQHGLSRRIICMMPSRTYSRDDITITCSSCTVCLTHFHQGDMIRSLICSHTFHLSCIDPWLSSHARCPNCNIEITGHTPIKHTTPPQPIPSGVSSVSPIIESNCTESTSIAVTSV